MSIPVPEKWVTASSIQVDNQPSFWGMRIPRETARIVSARIYDPSLQRCVGPALRWSRDGSNPLEQEISLEAGQSAHLFVFAKERKTSEYFIFPFTALNEDLVGPLYKYRDAKKDFSVVLCDEIGREYRFDIVVRNSDHFVEIEFKLTWRARLAMILGAFRLLGRALWFKR